MSVKQMVKKILPDKIIIILKEFLTALNNRRMIHKKQRISAFDKDKYPYGVNLIGDIRAETGLGQSMRIIARMLEQCGIPFVIIQIDSPGKLEQNNHEWDGKITDKAKYGINLIHINPSIWMQMYIELDEDILNYRYNIAYWLWELEEFPDKWLPCIETVNEIWTPSHFISNSIAKKTKKMVSTVPYDIEMKQDSFYNRDYFALPEEKFFFLVMYDLLSVSERKNPQGVIKAFKEAFSVNEKEVGLLIKVNHSGNHELEILKNDLHGYDNIYIIDRNLSRKEIESLIKDSDVLVSLHRCEGFGLPMAEAMYLGTPVIATNWSANTEFMDQNSACLVDYKLVEVQKDIGPYKKGSFWADADISQASRYMRKLAYDRKFYREIQENGQNMIRSEHGIKSMKAKIAGIYGDDLIST